MAIRGRFAQVVAEAFGIKVKGGNKYGARKYVYDGIEFDSESEAAFYAELKLQQRVGWLKIIARQVVVQLDEEVTMRPDFLIQDLKTNEKIFEEVKGHQTAAYRIKRRLWIARGPGRLRVWKMVGGRSRLIEEIVPKRPLPWSVVLYSDDANTDEGDD